MVSCGLLPTATTQDLQRFTITKRTREERKGSKRRGGGKKEEETRGWKRSVPAPLWEDVTGVLISLSQNKVKFLSTIFGPYCHNEGTVFTYTICKSGSL